MTTRPKTGKALIYCRVSTAEQEREGTSLDSQAQECRKRAAELGLTVERVTNEVYSGAELWDRPLLSRDRDDLKAGRFDALIAYSTDRLSRDPIHLMIIAEDCDRAGVALVFVTEPLDDSDEGKLVHYIRGYANKKEREKIRERSLRGKRTRVQSGKVHNMGPELYGYRRDREYGVRIIYEPEAAIVRRIYWEVAVEHQSFHAVARYLNDEGVPVPSAARAAAQGRTTPVYWTASTIWRIIRNPAYKGEEWVWRWHKVKARGGYKQVKRPDGEHIKLPASTTPAIVSPELWAQAQTSVQKQSGDHTRNEQVPYLLRGHIYCARCGRKMYASWYRPGTNKERPKVRSYRCSSNNSPEGLCGGRIANAEKIEAWAWEQISQALQSPEMIAAELERRRSRTNKSSLPSDLENTRRKVADCESKQARLLQRYSTATDDSFPWELVEREIGRIENEKRKWESTIREIEERITQQQESVEQLEALSAFRERAPRDLAGASWEDKRNAVQALDVRVTADGQEWHIDGAVPIGSNGDVLLQTPAGLPRRAGC